MKKDHPKSYLDYLFEHPDQVEDMEEAIRQYHSGNQNWGKPISLTPRWRES